MREISFIGHDQWDESGNKGKMLEKRGSTIMLREAGVKKKCLQDNIGMLSGTGPSCQVFV